MKATSPKVKIPTRFRMSFVHRFPHYSPRLVFSFGLIQLICGTVNVFLSLVLYRYDRDNQHGGGGQMHQAQQSLLTWLDLRAFILVYVRETARHTYFNLWIVLSGLITFLVSCRPYSRCQIRLFFVTSFVSVVVSGAYAILLSNTVIQQSIITTLIATTSSASKAVVDPYRLPPESMVLGNDIATSPDLLLIESHHRPFRLGTSHPLAKETSSSSSSSSTEPAHANRANLVLILHVFMLSFCVVTFVISIVSFSLVSHHLCSCSPFGSKLSPDYHIYDTSTWSRKERIIQWVMQQSQLTTTTTTTSTSTTDFTFSECQSANRLSIVLDSSCEAVLVPPLTPLCARPAQPPAPPTMLSQPQSEHKKRPRLLMPHHHHSSATNSSRLSMQDR